MWTDEITLIKDETDVNSNGFQTTSEAQNETVFCNVFSVGYNEFYKAAISGINLSKKVDIYTAEYSGEKRCILSGTEYEIVKTYEKNNGEITELTLSDIKTPEVI